MLLCYSCGYLFYIINMNIVLFQRYVWQHSQYSHDRIWNHTVKCTKTCETKLATLNVSDGNINNYLTTSAENEHI